MDNNQEVCRMSTCLVGSWESVCVAEWPTVEFCFWATSYAIIPLYSLGTTKKGLF